MLVSDEEKCQFVSFAQLSLISDDTIQTATVWSFLPMSVMPRVKAAASSSGIEPRMW